MPEKYRQPLKPQMKNKRQMRHESAGGRGGGAKKAKCFNVRSRATPDEANQPIATGRQENEEFLLANCSVQSVQSSNEKLKYSWPLPVTIGGERVTGIGSQLEPRTVRETLPRWRKQCRERETTNCNNSLSLVSAGKCSFDRSNYRATPFIQVEIQRQTDRN